MNGKVVVITGGTSGIGQIAAERLAGMGARIILMARDKARAETALARLKQCGPGAAHGVHYADLSVIAEMKRVAGEIAAAEPRIDVLINNTGALFYQRQETPDGLEMTFATNHVSYFVLTQLLLDRLKAAGPARVVSTSSMAHRGNVLNFDDLQMVHSYKSFTAYGRSKLCNILFTREFARQLVGTGVTANCLHPGFVNTRFGDGGRGAFASVFRLAKQIFAITPEKGAETIVYLASSKAVEGVSGNYFIKCAPATPTAEAQDDESARRLWQETEKLVR